MSTVRSPPRARPCHRRHALSLLLLVVVFGAGGCATRGFRPPSGVGQPAPEAQTALDEAATRCRGARTFTGNPRLTGRVGDERLAVRPDTGLTSTGDISLEVRVAGTSQLWLSGGKDRATLYLQSDDAALIWPAGEIVEALVGVRLDPDRLLAVLTGCVSRDLTIASAARFGDVIRITTPDGILFLEQPAGRWRILAGTFDGLIVSFDRLGLSFPEEFGVSSEPGRTPEVDLRIQHDQVNVNVDILPAAFARQVPAGARLITLEELRAAGPLRSRGGG